MGCASICEQRDEMGCVMGLMERVKEGIGGSGQTGGRREAETQAGAAAGSAELRMMELEMENFRLNKLVAELLLKNQELRRSN